MQAPLSSKASGKYLDREVGEEANASRRGGRVFPPPRPGYASSQPGCAAPAPPGGMEQDARPLLLKASIAEGSGLAHDAGNLLGALQLYCDLLALPGVLREEHRHYAEELRYLSGRSTALIDRLLNPSLPGSSADFRMPASNDEQAGGSIHEAEPLMLPDVIEHTLNLLNMIARREVRVAFEDGSQTAVSISREALERILVNLTKNAAEASPAEGAITLRVSCRKTSGSPARVVLLVEDQGCGMSAAAMKLLLEAPVVERKGPRGLGLRVVRELVAASEGEFTLRSRSGRGTTVQVTWPAAGDSGSGHLRADSTVRGGARQPELHGGATESEAQSIRIEPGRNQPGKSELMDTRRMLRAARQGSIVTVHGINGINGIEGGLQC